MPFPLGESFDPSQMPQQGQGGGQGGPAPSPLQSVVKLLSLRLPTVAGAHALAPQGILSGGPGPAPGGPSPMGDNPDAEAMWQWLQSLLNGGQGTPAPNVIPGSGAPSGGWGPLPDPDVIDKNPQPPSGGGSPTFPSPTDHTLPDMPMPYDGQPWSGLPDRYRQKPMPYGGSPWGSPTFGHGKRYGY